MYKMKQVTKVRAPKIKRGSLVPNSLRGAVPVRSRKPKVGKGAGAPKAPKVPKAAAAPAVPAIPSPEFGSMNSPMPQMPMKPLV